MTRTRYELFIYDMLPGTTLAFVELDGVRHEITVEKVNRREAYPELEEFFGFLEWLDSYEELITPHYASPEYPSRVRRPRVHSGA